MSSSLTRFEFQVGEINYQNFHNTPTEYKQYVKRILSMQAYAEKLGADEMGYQLNLAPDYHGRKGLARIVYDEATHAYMLYQILEKIGVSEFEAIKIAQGKLGNKQTQSLKGAEAVGDEKNTWFDLVLNNMLMDRAGGYMVSNFSQSSFLPWAKACEKIYEDEQWHKQFGLKQFELYLEKYNDNHADLSIKFSNWFVHALNFFGPPSINTQRKLSAYGIKRQSNEELRQQFIAEVKQILLERQLSYLLINNIQYQYPCKIIGELNGAS